MAFTDTLIALGIISWIILTVMWVVDYGFLRGTLAGTLRLIWLVPLFLAFFPRSKLEQLPRTISLKTIHVLLDDSMSMRAETGNGKSPLARSEKILEELNSECQRLGCLLKVTKLSETQEGVKQGFTPLANTLSPWFLTTGGDPWMILTDGGDQRPTDAWDEKLQGIGVGPQEKKRGLILGFKPQGHTNIWVEAPDSPLFSFMDKPLQVTATLRREKPDLDQETVQVQILTEDKTLATLNATFAAEEDAVDISTLIPPLGRGQHLLTIKALPTAAEAAIWDNSIHKTVEVMPNTVGVLHLLGAPSWDGRFLRRYLKSEPKYDLISFFILRDPGDMQMVNERELSLIPFPVDRLFNEELPNFHTVIIQNFALYQFLEPSYQENLVKFVQNGGGLLFVGGPRSLQTGDLSSSPLSEILPFTINDGASMRPDFSDKSGPYFDKDLRFQVELASPSPTQRALANVYDDWEKLGKTLAAHKDFKGLHHMERVKFKEGEYTPLLNARLPSGVKAPLAVASYPGKGRALWIFSDSLWRLALNPPPQASREVYNDFVKSSMTWLLRQELRKSLLLKNLQLTNVANQGTLWQVNLIGPAARYFRADASWNFEMCRGAVNLDQVLVEKTGPENWQLSGRLERSLASGQRCTARVRGTHPAFGALESSITSIVPDIYNDQEIQAAPNKLTELGRLTQAEVAFVGEGDIAPLQGWLDEVTGTFGVALPSRFKSVQDHYWVLNTWWIWLCLIAIPLEVVVRRWPELTASRREGEA